MGKKALSAALCVATGAAVLASGCARTAAGPDGATGSLAVAEAGHDQAHMETRVYTLSYVQRGIRYHPPPKVAISQNPPQHDESTDEWDRMSVQRVLDGIKSEKGAVTLVPGTNSLVVTDTPEKLEAVEKLIRRFDRPPKQVHMSVKLVVLSDADAERVKGQLSHIELASEAESLTLKGLDFSELQAFLRFIREQTQVRVIQASQLIVLDHEEATLRVGDMVRHAEAIGAQDSGLKAPKGPPFSPNTQLLVIPHVMGPDNNVILTIIPRTGPPRRPEPFEATEPRPRGGPRPPCTVRRVAVAKIMLRDRETAVLSGLRGQWRGETVNLLVLITPTIVSFEKGPDIDEMEKRAREALGRGFPLEEDVPPETPTPASGEAETR